MSDGSVREFGVGVLSDFLARDRRVRLYAIMFVASYLAFLTTGLIYVFSGPGHATGLFSTIVQLIIGTVPIASLYLWLFSLRRFRREEARFTDTYRMLTDSEKALMQRRLSSLYLDSQAPLWAMIIFVFTFFPIIAVGLSWGRVGTPPETLKTELILVDRRSEREARVLLDIVTLLEEEYQDKLKKNGSTPDNRSDRVKIQLSSIKSDIRGLEFGKPWGDAREYTAIEKRRVLLCLQINSRIYELVREAALDLRKSHVVTDLNDSYDRLVGILTKIGEIEEKLAGFPGLISL
jgi:hypothetical protein